MYVVKTFTGHKEGWKAVKSFKNPAEADVFATDLIQKNDCLCSDVKIIYKGE